MCHLLRMGVSSIFGPQSNSISSHVQSICDTMEIPHLEMRWDYRIRRENCLVNLYPHPSILSRVSCQSFFACCWYLANIWIKKKIIQRHTLTSLIHGVGKAIPSFMKQMTACCVYKSYWKHNAAQSIRQPCDSFQTQTITGTFFLQMKQMNVDQKRKQSGKFRLFF